jgi:hypothetical protein
MKFPKISVILLVVIQVFTPVALAQPLERIESLAIQQTDRALSFYSVDQSGQLTLLASFEGFYVQTEASIHRIQPLGRKVFEANHFVASPDGHHIAFTTQPYALFIYTLGKAELQQVEIPGEADILWSPNSDALVLVPPIDYNGSQDAISQGYLFDLISGELMPVGPPGWSEITFEWLPDAQGILFSSRGDACPSEGYCPFNIYRADRANQQITRLTDVASLLPQLQLSPTNSAHYCDAFTGFVSDDRLYYIVTCDHYNSIHSISLSGGGSRLEIDLAALYPDDTVCTAADIFPGPAGNYLITTSGSKLRVLPMSPTGQAAPAIQLDITRASGLAFSPDGSHLAFVSNDPGNQMSVVNWQTGEVTTFPIMGRADIFQWFDDHRLLYTEYENLFYLTGPGPTWKLDISTGDETELTQGMEGSVWFFPRQSGHENSVIPWWCD